MGTEWLRRPRRHFLLDPALGRLSGHVQVVVGLEVDPELRGVAEVAGGSDTFLSAKPDKLIPGIHILQVVARFGLTPGDQSLSFDSGIFRNSRMFEQGRPLRDGHLLSSVQTIGGEP